MPGYYYLTFQNRGRIEKTQDRKEKNKTSENRRFRKGCKISILGPQSFNVTHLLQIKADGSDGGDDRV